MAAERSPRLFLSDILDACDAIAEILRTVAEADFAADRLSRSAVLYEMITIGEAANRLPDDLRTRYPAVPWRYAIDMRNYAAHGYFALATDRVWQTVNEDIPLLRAQIAAIIDREFPAPAVETT